MAPDNCAEYLIDIAEEILFPVDKIRAQAEAMSPSQLALAKTAIDFYRNVGSGKKFVAMFEEWDLPTIVRELY